MIIFESVLTMAEIEERFFDRVTEIPSKDRKSISKPLKRKVGIGNIKKRGVLDLL